MALLEVLISLCFSPPSRPFSRAACERAAAARTSSPVQTLGPVSAFLHRARRRCALAQSRNAQRRAASDRSHQDNQKPGATSRIIPVPDDRARCKSRSARRSTPLSESADNCCEFLETDLSAQLL